MSEQVIDNENKEEKATAAQVEADEKVEALGADKEDREEIDELKASLEKANGKYYYLAAELENTRKRFEREKENLLKFGNEKLLKSLLEVVDNLDRTVDSIKDDEDEKVKNIVVGIEMVQKQFLDSLGKFGLEEVKALGEIFDPNFHEAMAQNEDENAKEGEVLVEYQKGYILNGRLLRPSKVVVAK